MEVIVAYFKVISQYFLRGNEKNHMSDNWYSCHMWSKF